MRYAYLIALILFVASCTKKPGNNPTPNTPTPVDSSGSKIKYWSHFIPNWHEGDTLTGSYYVTDSNGNTTDYGNDTIYTFVSHGAVDTSGIIHNGVRYYIWTAKVIPNPEYEYLFVNDTFKDNQSNYVNVYVNTSFDTTNAYSSGLFSQADPAKYKDEYGDWYKQRQRLNLSYKKGSPFKANNTMIRYEGTYWGINIKR